MWDRRRAWLEGLKDGWSQGELTVGLTWDTPDHPNSVAYDHGATLGERLARMLKGGQ